MYDVLLEMDIAAGRFLDVAKTYERMGDAESAVQYYLQAGHEYDAVQLLLPRARAAVLWSGTAHDWPPPTAGSQHGSAAAKQVSRIEELVNSSSSSGSSNVPKALQGCLLEVRMLRYLLDNGGGAAAGGGGGKGAPQRVGGGGGGSGGGATDGLLSRWDQWRGRLAGLVAGGAAAAGASPDAGSSTAVFGRLCLLRLLSAEALERARGLLGDAERTAAAAGAAAGKKGSGSGRNSGPGASPGGAGASAGAALSLSAVTAAAVDLLRLWEPYRRLLAADVLRVLRRAVAQPTAAVLSARDACVLAALQSYHCVRPAAVAAGGGGATLGGSYNTALQVSCSANAAWVKQAALKLQVQPASSSAPPQQQAVREVGSADFAAAALAYWREELEGRSCSVLTVLLALERHLQPDYEAFRARGGTAVGPGGSGGRGPGGAAAAAGAGARARAGAQAGGASPGGVDATQLRAQLLVAAVQEVEFLLQVCELLMSQELARKRHPVDAS